MKVTGWDGNGPLRDGMSSCLRRDRQPGPDESPTSIPCIVLVGSSTQKRKYMEKFQIQSCRCLNSTAGKMDEDSG